MIPARISEWAAAGESETQEFKESTGQRRAAAKAVCAMLNHRGGRVVFGVKPGGTVVGQLIGEDTEADVAAEIGTIEPPVYPRIERVDIGNGWAVLVVTVPTGAFPPYSVRGRAWRRVGTTNVHLSGDEYNRMLLDRVHEERRWENEEASGWTVADLDSAEISRTVDEAIRRGRLEEPGTREPESLLRGFRLLRGDVLLRAAVVLFGRLEHLGSAYQPVDKVRSARNVLGSAGLQTGMSGPHTRRGDRSAARPLPV